MQQNQEIWKFQFVEGRQLLSTDLPRHDIGNVVAGAYRNGHWQVFEHPAVSGVVMRFTRGKACSIDGAKSAAAREIRRQLAAHGIRVEIRRVKK